MRPFRVLMAVSAAALVATACGDDSTAPAAAPSGAGASSSSPSASAGSDLAALPPEQILAKAKTALESADSVRLKGGGSSGSDTFEVDMRYGTGAKAYGTVSSSGQTIELRRVGQTVYLKADAAFWQATGGAQAAKLFGGKFLKAPLTDPRVKQLADFTDKATFVGEVLDPGGDLTKGEVKQIDGRSAIGLVDKTTATNEGGTLYVATEGEPYPLQLVPDAASKDDGELSFTEYGEPVEVKVPPAAETVDVTKLGAN